MLLCTYGFFRELRPSEPFSSEFLSGEWRDLTPENVIQQVFPVGTYSYLSLLVVAFLITDMLRCVGLFEEVFSVDFNRNANAMSTMFCFVTDTSHSSLCQR